MTSSAPLHGLFVGLCVVDVVHRVSHHPGHDEKVTALSREVVAGGPASNAAVTFAALGGEPTLVTAVGGGAFAAVALADLERHAVVVTDVAAGDPGFELSVSAVTVDADDGSRSVVSMDGGALAAAAPEVRAVLSGADADVVLVDGHYPRLAVAAARWGRTRRIPVVLDAGRWKPHFAELLPLVDEVVCSGDFRTPAGSGFPAVAAYCHAAGAAVVAQTHGADPVEVSVEGRYAILPVPAVPVVDTLGAGDVLHGAYALQRAARVPPEEALRRAVATASLRCRFVGARRWLEELA